MSILGNTGDHDVILVLRKAIPWQWTLAGFAISACLRYRARFGREFTRQHTYYSLFFTVLLSFGGGTVASLFLANAPWSYAASYPTGAVMACWLLCNFYPRDLFARVASWQPLKTVLFCLDAVTWFDSMRHTVLKAQSQADSLAMMVMGGIFAGYGGMLLAALESRLRTGTAPPTEFWQPTRNTVAVLGTVLPIALSRSLNLPNVLPIGFEGLGLLLCVIVGGLNSLPQPPVPVVPPLERERDRDV